LLLANFGGTLLEVLFEVSLFLDLQVVHEVSIRLEVALEHGFHLVAAILQGVDRIVVAHENLGGEVLEAV
jgi:hypothetical protein